MSTGIVLFLFAVVVMAIAAICAVVVHIEKNFSGEKYDERQKIARGNACRFSLWIGEIYYLILLPYFVMHIGKGTWKVEPFLLITAGMVLQLLGFHIYCLLTHSALPLGQKPLSAAISYFFLGSMYLVQFFRWRIPGSPVGFFGTESYAMFQLLITLFFFSLSAMHLISHLRKEED